MIENSDTPSIFRSPTLTPTTLSLDTKNLK